MRSHLSRLNPAVSWAALVIALLALLAGAAGVGYAAGTIGTADIKNNAVTAKKIKANAVKGAKVKDGSLTAADLAPGEKQKPAPLSNGGEGDCLWQSGGALLPGVGAPTYRKDQFGTVHLAGLAVSSDAAGGDGDCDFSAIGQSADAIVFVLPAGYVPAKSVIAGGLSGGDTVIIVGPQGLVSGSLTLPPGAVATGSASAAGVALDGISFEPVGSKVVLP